MLLFNYKKMKKKFLTIFLGIIISLFSANYCYAALPAIEIETLEVSITTSASAVLNWFYDVDPEDVRQFKILWRERTEDSTEAWKAKYPSVANGPDYSYSLRGLLESTEYEWRIKAEAPNPIHDSSYSDGPIFVTLTPPLLGSPPVGEGEGEDSIPIELVSLFENIGNLKEATDAFMEFALLVGFAIGPILIIYAGFLLLTKQDDPTAAGQAKKIILWTVVSLSIMLFAKGIPSVVKDLFK